MRKLLDILGGTCIIWLPILALAIAKWVSQIITPEILMNCFIVFGVICLVTVIVTSKK